MCMPSSALTMLTLHAHRLHSTPGDSLECRVVKATLNLFANRPGGCLDRAALLACRDLFRPSKAGGLSLEAWKNMPNYPMVNIANLALVLEPSKSLMLRVRINGRGRYLPPAVLARAVLVNRWTMHYEWIVRQQIVKFRKLFPPRRVCKYCLEPLLFDGDVYDNRRCCRNGYFSWMQKALESTVQVLVMECGRVKVPSMQRPWMQDNEKLAVALAKAGPLGQGSTEVAAPGGDAGGGSSVIMEHQGSAEEANDEDASLVTSVKSVNSEQSSMKSKKSTDRLKSSSAKSSKSRENK